MPRPSNNYKVKAYMYDENKNTYEVVEDSEGGIWVRNTRLGSSWSQTTVSPRNHMRPDLETYLNACEGNFGWRIERVGEPKAADVRASCDERGSWDHLKG